MPTDETLPILVELGRKVSVLTERVETVEAENQALRTENKALKELLHKQGEAKFAKAPKFTENYNEKARYRFVWRDYQASVDGCLETKFLNTRLRYNPIQVRMVFVISLCICSYLPTNL